MQQTAPLHRGFSAAPVMVVIATGILAGLVWRDFFIAVPQIAVWDAVHPLQGLRSIANLGLLLLVETVAAALFAAYILATLTRRRSDRPAPMSLAHRSKVVMRGMICAIVLAFVAFSLGKWRIPTVIELVFPLVGVLFAAYSSWWWLGGVRSKLCLALQWGLLAVVPLVGGTWVMQNSVEDQPLVTRVRPVTSAEKRTVMAKFQHSEEGDAGDRRVVLTEEDVDILFQMAAAVADGRVRLAGRVGRTNSGSIRATIPLSRSADARRFLNLHMELSGSVEHGRVTFRVQRLQVGRIEIPSLLCSALSLAIRDFAERDPHVSQIVRRTEMLSIRDHQVTIAGNWRGLRKSVTGRVMAEMGARPELALETRVYVAHLLEQESPLVGRDGDARFLWVTKRVFQLARERTSAGHDAVEENRAALLALGMLIGHPKLERLIGEVMTPELRERRKTRRMDVTMYGRRDWPRHFWLSAALAVLSNERIGTAIGVLKEELDAGDGGSGFSFADLAADMAGTRLAELATRHRTDARKIQWELSHISAMDAILPPIDDLPEGLPESEFVRQYGGVDGERYRQLLGEIERRLATCRVLQD